MARILIIDDDAAFLATLQATLRSLGHSVIALDNGAAGVAQLREGGVDMAFVDFRMPGMDGIAVLRARQDHATARQVPLVMLTAYASSSNTIEAMTLGAFDHLVKPVGRAEIVEVVQRALHSAADAPEPGAASAAPAEEADALIGHSPAMRTVHKRIGLAASADLPVLITGETGTGKELAARALHHASARAQRAFVAVNCAAIPLELMESELFGHRKGAFSGATSDRIGLIRQADGGTLFLDEIGDMPLPMQVKLLRVLQERTFERVGSNKTQSVDVRIIAATHKNLESMIEVGSFREDLYYRLNVFPIEMAPLRERVEDIPLLMNELISRMEHEKRGSIRFNSAAIMSLCRHGWPGNVRELANLVERMAIMHPYGVIGVAELPKKFRYVDDEDEQMVDSLRSDLEERVAINGHTPDFTSNALLPPEGLDLKDYLGGLEQGLIQQALDDANGIVARAAERLRIRRTTLVEKMRKYGMSRREGDEQADD